MLDVTAVHFGIGVVISRSISILLIILEYNYYFNLLKNNNRKQHKVKNYYRIFWVKQIIPTAYLILKPIYIVKV